MPDTDIIGTKYREDTEMKKSAIALTAALMMAAAPAFAADPNEIRATTRPPRASIT